MPSENAYTKHREICIEKLYSRLNPMQREAVCTVNGPLLVLAGAGIKSWCPVFKKSRKYKNSRDILTLSRLQKKLSSGLFYLVQPFECEFSFILQFWYR
jgi:hypothetical protein